ncbi:YncE family protein [Candidatus Acetothermia bacterium]|nr:YncE family protein [Candidatus Acetothermia bacterium]
MSRFLRVLAILACVSFILPAASEFSNISKSGAVIIPGASIQALKTCGTKVFVIAELRNNRVFLHQIDAATRKIEGTQVPNATAPALLELPFLSDPKSLELSPDCSTAYVPGFSDGNLYIINLLNKQIVQKIAVGKGSQDLALSSTGKVFVVNSLDNEVAIVDLSTSSVKSKIPVGNVPTSIALYESGAYFRGFVTNFQDDSISVLDTFNDREIRRIPSAGSRPFAIATAVHTMLGDLYAYYVTSVDDSLNRINITTLEIDTPVSVGNTPRAVLLSNYAYTDPNGNIVQLIYTANSGVSDGRSGISLSLPAYIASSAERAEFHKTLSWGTSELLDKATVVCLNSDKGTDLFPNPVTCGQANELWAANLANRGEIAIYDIKSMARELGVRPLE